MEKNSKKVEKLRGYLHAYADYADSYVSTINS